MNLMPRKSWKYSQKFIAGLTIQNDLQNLEIQRKKLKMLFGIMALYGGVRKFKREN